jgi:hypothetical protein
MTRRILLLALSAAVACSAKEGTTTDSASGSTTPAAATPAATSSSGDKDLADVTKYELTMAGIDKLFAAQRNLGLKLKAMSPAEREATAMHNDNNASMDDMVRNIEKAPAYVAAIREAGLSPREYVLITVSMMQSGMAAGVIKMRPKDNVDSLAREMKANPANVRFIMEHEAELTKKQTEMAAEMKRLGISDSE